MPTEWGPICGEANRLRLLRLMPQWFSCTLRAVKSWIPICLCVNIPVLAPRLQQLQMLSEYAVTHACNQHRKHSGVQGRCNQDSKARSVTMMISDSCPECEGDHLDIQVPAPHPRPAHFIPLAPAHLQCIDM